MIRVISYNIRCNTPRDGENAWPHRKERVAALLYRHEPDLIGLQEVTQDQLADLVTRLPDYDWVGVGRDDGKTGGEYTPIFYRRDKFSLEESGNFWLSETPQVIGSVGWDASLPRIATWATLTDRQSGATLLHLNTHFDHRGMESQIHAAYLLRQFMLERIQEQPAVITGDFNCDEESATYSALTTTDGKQSPVLIDTMHKRLHRGPTATFNGDFTDPLHAKIDYIFLCATPQKSLSVQSHAILDDKESGVYPSDHLPVLVDMQVNVT